MQLNFIQSNWLRQYPFRAGHGLIDLNNVGVPKDIIVGLRITCLASDLDVYINRIYINDGVVGISFSGNNGDIGFAIATVDNDNQSIPINNYSKGIIGNVVIGNALSIKPKHTYIFDSTNGLVEPSTILVAPTPQVSSINIKGTKYTGNVSLTSSSLNISVGDAIELSVQNPSIIKSRGDKKPEYLTCSNNVISGINSVKPNHDGNIDIYAIEPLAISTATINGIDQLQLTTPQLGLSMTLPSWMNGSDVVKNLCKLVNIPPADTTDTYTDVTTINQSTLPEWASWPQHE